MKFPPCIIATLIFSFSATAAEMPVCTTDLGGNAPVGVTTKFDITTEKELILSVVNERQETIELDWNKSAFVHTNGQSVGVIPGATRRANVGAVLPPSVIPGLAAFTDIVVAREDVTIKEVKPLLDSDTTGVVNLVLSTNVGSIDHRWKRWIDTDAYSRMTEAEDARNRAKAASEKASRAKQIQRWAAVGTAVGLLAAVSGAANAESDLVLGGLTIALAGGGTFGVVRHNGSKLKKERSEALQRAEALDELNKNTPPCTVP